MKNEIANFNSKIKKLILIIVIILKISLINSELRFVFEIFRHGARAPNLLSNNNIDILGEVWTQGPGELSEFGMRQQYLLGYRNRLRYKNFLSNSFDSKEIYILSTDFNRTIMSAQSQLQGLFPPGTGMTINQSLIEKAIPPIKDTNFTSEQIKLGNLTLPFQIQVFPIHLFDYKNKLHFLYDPKVCPQANVVIENRKMYQKVLDFNQKFNKTFGEKLANMLNITEQKFFSQYENIHEICDAYLADYTEGKEFKKLKENNIDLEELYQYALEHLTMDVLEVHSGDFTLGVASMSTNFKEINDWMIKRIISDKSNLGYKAYNDPKFVMYSSHDRNLGDLLTYLKTVFKLNETDAIYPFYASSFLFELYRRENYDTNKLDEKDYYVQVTYNDNLILNITFNEFSQQIITKSNSTEQIGKFCGWDNADPIKENSFNYFIITTVIFFIISIGEFIFILFQKRKVNNDVGIIPITSSQLL